MAIIYKFYLTKSKFDLYCFLILLITLFSYLQQKELKSNFWQETNFISEYIQISISGKNTLPLEGMLQTSVYEKWKQTKNN